MKSIIVSQTKGNLLKLQIGELEVGTSPLNFQFQIHCFYVMGLGYLGLGDYIKAESDLSKLRELDINHQRGQVLCKW